MIDLLNLNVQPDVASFERYREIIQICASLYVLFQWSEMSPDGFGRDWLFRCDVPQVCVPLLMCTCLIDGKLMVDDTCCLSVRLCE